MTKTITIDGENYEVNVEAAIKAGLLKKAVTHTTGDFYKDDTKADSEVFSDKEFKRFVHGQKFIKIKCTLNEA